MNINFEMDVILVEIPGVVILDGDIGFKVVTGTFLKLWKLELLMALLLF